MSDRTEGVMAGRSCPWCSAVAPDAATACPSCGAALAQRETIGDLVIPGVTALDPALADLEGRPMRLAGPSPSQGMASGVMVAALMGGPVGLAALGGMAAVGAAEYIGAGRTHLGAPDLENVGRPSGAPLQALERLEHPEEAPGAAELDPWRDDPTLVAAAPAADPWRDLPAASTPVTPPPAPDLDPWRDEPGRDRA